MATVKKTLVLVEDHVMVRHGLADYFTQKTGWTVVGEASTYDEAVRVIREVQPFAAIIDVRLGDRESFGLLQDTALAGLSVKYIVYSMFRMPWVVKKAMSLGAAGYVSKSADEYEIVHALDIVYEGGMYVEKSLSESLMNINTVLAPLTSREQTVFLLIQMGKSNTEIAAELGIAVITVENYICRICDKTGADGRDGIKKIGI